VRMPWQDIPGDDGFRRSLSVTRAVCGAGLLLPPVLSLCALAILGAPGAPPHEEPILAAALAVLALLLGPVAPFVREGMARAGIGAHLEGGRDTGDRLPVYATFTRASLAAYGIALLPSVFGFIVAVFMRSAVPLGVGAVLTYVGCLAFWPRRLVWTRWRWQAKIGREDEVTAS
jgi:hypothetical protein